MSRWRIDQGDCLAVMAGTDADSADAIITDPPYDLTAASRGGSARTNDPATPFGRHRLQSRDGGGFMGQAWDATGVAFDSATWAAALRVAKPGAHLVAFGGTRTHHRLMVAIEDAGWEIRDCLMWLYGSGFPKSHNLSGGVGTALKPAWEPIILARKPLAGTVAANVARYGTGALNIDACRLETGGALKWSAPRGMGFSGGHNTPGAVGTRNSVGRWPANVVLDEDAAAALDATVGERMSGRLDRSQIKAANKTYGQQPKKLQGIYEADTGGPSRFYYTAKASRSEREAGLNGAEMRLVRRYGEQAQGPLPQQTPRTERSAANHHPTVKPLALMRWLVRLVAPPGGLVLDPFAGSGSTGCAAVLEGCRFVGVDQDADYCEVARRRIAHWAGEVGLFAVAD